LFFFKSTHPTAIFTLSLHDALPICDLGHVRAAAEEDFALPAVAGEELSVVDLDARDARERGERADGLRQRGDVDAEDLDGGVAVDRKSTRLNSSHLGISYAVFCLKK